MADSLKQPGQAGTEDGIEFSSEVMSRGVSLLLSSGLLKPEAEERGQVLAELVGAILRGAKTPER